MEGESITGDVDAPVAAERHALLGAKVCVEAIAGGVGALTRYVLGRLKPYIANLCEMPLTDKMFDGLVLPERPTQSDDLFSCYFGEQKLVSRSD
jgi:hypothetical protein